MYMVLMATRCLKHIVQALKKHIGELVPRVNAGGRKARCYLAYDFVFYVIVFRFLKPQGGAYSAYFTRARVRRAYVILSYCECLLVVYAGQMQKWHAVSCMAPGRPVVCDAMRGWAWGPT